MKSRLLNGKLLNGKKLKLFIINNNNKKIYKTYRLLMRGWGWFVLNK